MNKFKYESGTTQIGDTAKKSKSGVTNVKAGQILRIKILYY